MKKRHLKALLSITPSLKWLGILIVCHSISAEPVILSFRPVNGVIELETTLDQGFDYVALRLRNTVDGADQVWVSSSVPERASRASFRCPLPPESFFLVVETGHGAPPIGALSGGGHVDFVIPEIGGGAMGVESRPYHTLSRLGYGPSTADLEEIETLGVASYIERQLNPETIEESDGRLGELADEAFKTYRPGRDTVVIPREADLTFFKGNAPVPNQWNALEFDDSGEGWLQGATPIGRGRGGLATKLEDMQDNGNQPGYLSVFMRIEFFLDDPSLLQNLILRNIYDDGFVAYLNGKEVARDNIEGHRPGRQIMATQGFKYPRWKEFPLDADDYQLVAGRNVLAIQLHNYRRTDFDSLMDTTLLSREFQPEHERLEIEGIDALQDLLHARGIFSRRQLQAVLGEFWENHFTTDYDKVVEYLDELETIEGRDVMPPNRAAYEAAQMELAEYQFFYDNALGNFGDLLLYSATSPSQLIYLDNIINRVGEANENYAREILELFAFGVDNRYTQSDIEELSRAFTGWQIRKVFPEYRPAFPQSSLHPPTTSSFEPVDTPLFERSTGWNYFRGTRAPSRSNGRATLAWATPSFDAKFWFEGEAPFGFDFDNPESDHQIATSTGRMHGSHVTTYFRREFTIASLESLENLLLSIRYDDGYIAYLNGIEIARSETMEEAGRIAHHRFTTPQKHLAIEPVEFVDVSRVVGRLRPAPAINVLAIEVHNSDVRDTNFYFEAGLVTRSRGEGSIDEDDPNGVWTFRFNPDDHDFGEKVIFEGTPHEMRVPAGRTGIEGLGDALDVVTHMVDHPSTSEFICMKLINRFVSDGISLRSYRERSAEPGLLELMDRAISAWHSTKPAGNIKTVLTEIFSLEHPQNYFWSKGAHQAKVKTPIEYINSTVRALDWPIRRNRLAAEGEAMGMHFFTRDDPDGWSEKGFDWMNTGGLLKRLTFAGGLPRLARNHYLDRWNVRRFLLDRELESADEIVAHFDHLLFEGRLTKEERNVFVQFANTKPDGNPSLFRPSRRDYFERAGDLIGLILSTPSLQFQ